MKIRNKKLIYLIITILMLGLGACTTSDNETPVVTQEPPAGDNAPLANTNWRLISYGPPGAETPVIEGTDMTLEFDAGVIAGGFSGCNTFGAEYEVLDRNRISIHEIIATEIACDAEGVMEQELRYFEALRSASRFEVSGDTLTIWYGDGQSALHFSRLTGSTPVPVTPSPDA